MNLTPKQIQALRIAVAEVAGWKKFYSIIREEDRWMYPESGEDAELPPNYPADLNAVHEVEKVLEGPRHVPPLGQTKEYFNHLIDICGCDTLVIFTTALQRCIALLMTLAPAKWKVIQNLKD